MIYLLDSNTCIRYLNGRSESIRRHFEAMRPEEIALCSVVKAELFFGAVKSANPERNLLRVHRFAERLVSFPFDDPAALVYGEIRSRLEKSGTPIGPNDLLIAAIALAQGATLVTHNTREFARVPELPLVDWE